MNSCFGPFKDFLLRRTFHENTSIFRGNNVTENNKKKKIRSALYATASNTKIILGKTASIRVHSNTTIHYDLS